MCGLLHTWILIFDIAIPYLRPNKATNWNFLVPSGLFVTKAPCSSPFSPAQHNCWREESPNMWNTFLGQVIIFFLWVNEGNYKNWGEENNLWTCSNCEGCKSVCVLNTTRLTVFPRLQITRSAESFMYVICTIISAPWSFIFQPYQHAYLHSLLTYSVN